MCYTVCKRASIELQGCTLVANLQNTYPKIYTIICMQHAFVETKITDFVCNRTLLHTDIQHKHVVL